jgi:hypothetical protein
MIECVFTIDYEIYGNGCGSLHDLVFEPARQLTAIFDQHQAKFVNFVEAIEFSQIERHCSDSVAANIRRQIRELHEQGHEIALHLHPQWANAQYHAGQWELDYAEYNLCVLPPDRIARIVDDALAWLRGVVGDPAFTPLSFRAGNWLFQPTRDAAAVLAARGIKIDSSVFKGGLQRQHRLDYRPACKNGWYWTFADDVNVPSPNGGLLELPIHSQMVPFWRMLTGKRMALQQKSASTGTRCSTNSPKRPPGSSRLRDHLRLRYPLKFDFCRMTLVEMTRMTETVLRADESSPNVLKPMVAIGHTKDLVDFGAIDAFLGWLRQRSIPVSTLAAVYDRCLPFSKLAQVSNQAGISAAEFPLHASTSGR